MCSFWSIKTTRASNHFLRTAFKSRLTSKEEATLKRVLDDRHEVNYYSSRREETTWKS